MRGREGGEDYNFFDAVACGFAEDADGKLWINHNFHRSDPRTFACGGSASHAPPAVLVQDCCSTCRPPSGLAQQ